MALCWSDNLVLDGRRLRPDLGAARAADSKCRAQAPSKPHPSQWEAFLSVTCVPINPCIIKNKACDDVSLTSQKHGNPEAKKDASTRSWGNSRPRASPSTARYHPHRHSEELAAPGFHSLPPPIGTCQRMAVGVKSPPPLTTPLPFTCQEPPKRPPASAACPGSSPTAMRIPPNKARAISPHDPTASSHSSPSTSSYFLSFVLGCKEEEKKHVLLEFVSESLVAGSS